jgi:hypothetical protein
MDTGLESMREEVVVFWSVDLYSDMTSNMFSALRIRLIPQQAEGDQLQLFRGSVGYVL